jgi:hypothetical protein
LIEEDENEKEAPVTGRTRLEKAFISLGLACLIITIGLLLSTAPMNPNSNEYLNITVVCGLLFGFAVFFEGYGYYILPTNYEREIAYFGSPVLFQVARILFRIPYVLLTYNGGLIIGELNMELIGLYIILFLPSVISQISFRWTRLQDWLRSFNTA